MTMIITICKGYDNSYVILKSKDERFRKKWGSEVKVPVSAIYDVLGRISSWCNNELGEACLFEVD